MADQHISCHSQPDLSTFTAAELKTCLEHNTMERSLYEAEHFAEQHY